MKATPSSSTSRNVLYVLVIAAIAVVVALVARSTPGLVTVSAIPIVAVLLICPIAMFFMMRGMNGRPR